VVSINVISANDRPVVFVSDDPLHPGSSALFVVGTSGNDHIQVDNNCSQQFEVEINGGGLEFDQTYTGPFSRIVIYGLAGNDHLQANGICATEVWMFGGDGDDHLQGGQFSNMLLGGAGDDHIQSGQGRDVLIGGIGADHVQA